MSIDLEETFYSAMTLMVAAGVIFIVPTMIVTKGCTNRAFERQAVSVGAGSYKPNGDFYWTISKGEKDGD